VGTVSALAATASSPSLLKAKQEAEAKGFIFLTNHDEIIAHAKKEGRIRVLSGQDQNSLKAVIDAFKKKYPFVDVRGEAIDGTEIYTRMREIRSSALGCQLCGNDFYPLPPRCKRLTWALALA
jgi:ABC-type glycerol-3-phosphate transport system substrate-binding protein